MSALAIDLRRTAGYIVADRQGRLVGKVECPMYGTAPDVPDALSVKSGLFSRRRRLVPADTIEQIDGTSGVIGFHLDVPPQPAFERVVLVFGLKTTTSRQKRLAVGRQLGSPPQVASRREL